MSRFKKGSPEAREYMARVRAKKLDKVEEVPAEAKPEPGPTPKYRHYSKPQSLAPEDRVGKYGGQVYTYGYHRPRDERSGYGCERYGRNRR